MDKFRVVSVILIILVNISYLNYRIKLYQKLVSVNATVKENAVAFNSRHSLSLEIKTKEYKRAFEIRYVLLSWQIQDKMKLAKDDQIKVFISPSDTVKLNNNNNRTYRNFLSIPVNNIKAYGVSSKDGWRSFSIYKDMLIDIADMLIFSFLLIATFSIQSGFDRYKLLNIAFICCFIFFTIAQYIYEKF